MYMLVSTLELSSEPINSSMYHHIFHEGTLGCFSTTFLRKAQLTWLLSKNLVPKV